MIKKTFKSFLRHGRDSRYGSGRDAVAAALYAATAGVEDITDHGGWRNWLAARP